jgi:hypothetical protein
MHKKRTCFLLFALLVVLAGCSKKEAAEPEPTDPLQRERFRLVAKVKQVAGKKHPEFAQRIGADVDSAIQTGADALYLIGPNLTDTGKGYRLYWVDQTFIAEEFAAEDAKWEGIKADTFSIGAHVSQVKIRLYDVPSFTQQETFARGLPYFISDASAGEPAGTVMYGQDIPVRLRIRRGATAVPAALAFQVPTTSGNIVMFAYPALANAPADQQLAQTYKWTRGLPPGATLQGILWLVEPPSGSGQPPPLSNPVTVEFRVAVRPPVQ